MSLVVISEKSRIEYQCLSTDIVANKVSGAGWVGATVYTTDTKQYYRVLPDLTLELMTSGFNKINKNYATKTVTISASANLSNEFDMTNHTVGYVITPATLVSCEIGFQIASSSSGTFFILRDGVTGSPVSIRGVATSGSRAYPLPSQLAGAGYVKLWSKTTESGSEVAVPQDPTKTFTIILKE